MRNAIRKIHLSKTILANNTRLTRVNRQLKGNRHEKKETVCPSETNIIIYNVTNGSMVLQSQEIINATKSKHVATVTLLFWLFRVIYAWFVWPLSKKMVQQFLCIFCGNSKEVMAADVMDAMKKNKATDERSFKEEYRKLRHCSSPNLLEKKITSYYF